MIPIDSILNSVKKQLGIAPDYEPFDPDIIIHINTVFSILHQLGAGQSQAAQSHQIIYVSQGQAAL